MNTDNSNTYNLMYRFQVEMVLLPIQFKEVPHILNNFILEINKSHEIAIIEMGASEIGEIKNLCRIAKPTSGLITNIGKAHLEGFGNFEGVIKAKTELYHFLEENNGTQFVNRNDDLLIKVMREVSKACNPINDKRGTIEYRRQVAGVLAKRVILLAEKRALYKRKNK